MQKKCWMRYGRNGCGKWRCVSAAGSAVFKSETFFEFGIQMLIGRLGSEMRGIGTQLWVEV